LLSCETIIIVTRIVWRSNPLGDLTALPRPSSWISRAASQAGEGRGGRAGKKMEGEGGREEGRERREGNRDRKEGKNW